MCHLSVCLLHYFCAGTHDIINSSVSVHDSVINISATFISNSAAGGAFLNFIYVSKVNGSINFTRSHCLALNRSDISGGFMIPLTNLWPGHYVMYVYDIESNMTLNNGINYQANSNAFDINGGIQSTVNVLKFQCQCLPFRARWLITDK